MIGFLIEQMGLSVRIELKSFADGDQAWAALGKEEPELFITDIEHPGLDGSLLLQRLEAKKVTYPILVLTGQPKESVKGFSKGKCPSLNLTVMQKDLLEEDKLDKYLTSILDRLDS